MPATAVKQTATHPIERRFPIITSLPASKVRAYRKRVQRGAEDLDERQPGWWRNIRISRLCMNFASFDPESPESCGCIGAQLSAKYEPYTSLPLGRLRGEYMKWMDRLGIISYSRGRRSEVSYGYCIPGRDWDASEAIMDAAWDLLDQLWANEVRKRRDG